MWAKEQRVTIKVPRIAVKILVRVLQGDPGPRAKVVQRVSTTANEISVEEDGEA